MLARSASSFLPMKQIDGSRCSFDIVVADCKRPTPYCNSSLTTVIMPTSGTVDILASQFDLGGFDNCGPLKAITFSQESWRGRMRALRGIAASLTPEQVTAFDEEHAAMLAGMVDQHFPILHRIHAQIFTPKVL